MFRLCVDGWNYRIWIISLKHFTFGLFCIRKIAQRWMNEWKLTQDVFFVWREILLTCIRLVPLNLLRLIDASKARGGIYFTRNSLWMPLLRERENHLPVFTRFNFEWVYSQQWASYAVWLFTFWWIYQMIMMLFIYKQILWITL